MFMYMHIYMHIYTQTQTDDRQIDQITSRQITQIQTHINGAMLCDSASLRS